MLTVLNTLKRLAAMVEPAMKKRMYAIFIAPCPRRRAPRDRLESLSVPIVTESDPVRNCYEGSLVESRRR